MTIKEMKLHMFGTDVDKIGPGTTANKNDRKG